MTLSGNFFTFQCAESLYGFGIARHESLAPCLVELDLGLDSMARFKQTLYEALPLGMSRLAWKRQTLLQCQSIQSNGFFRITRKIGQGFCQERIGHIGCLQVFEEGNQILQSCCRQRTVDCAFV